jgi:hypothetical protein
MSLLAEEDKMHSQTVKNFELASDIFAVIAIIAGMVIFGKYGIQNEGIISLYISALIFVFVLPKIIISMLTEQISMKGLNYNKKETPVLYRVVLILFISLWILSVIGIFKYWNFLPAV